MKKVFLLTLMVVFPDSRNDSGSNLSYLFLLFAVFLLLYFKVSLHPQPILRDFLFLVNNPIDAKTIKNPRYHQFLTRGVEVVLSN